MTIKRLRTVQISDSLQDRVRNILDASSDLSPRGGSRSSSLTGTCLVLFSYSENGLEVLGNTVKSLVSEFRLPVGSVQYAPTLGAANELMDAMSKSAPTHTLDSCTCCVVKPHAVRQGNVGDILDLIIAQGFQSIFNI